MGQERRKYIRFNVPLKAKVNLNTQVDAFKEGLTWDFSREGLRLVLKDFDIIHGTNAQLKIFIPEKQEPVDVEAKVVWTKSGNNNWEIGMELENITKEEKSAILDYVYEEWKKKKLKDKEE